MALYAQSIPIFTQHAHEITSCFSHGLLTIMAYLVSIMWRVTSTESTGSSYLWLSGSSYLWLTIRPIFSDRWLYMLKSILLLPNFRMKFFLPFELLSSDLFDLLIFLSYFTDGAFII